MRLSTKFWFHYIYAFALLTSTWFMCISLYLFEHLQPHVNYISNNFDTLRSKWKMNAMATIWIVRSSERTPKRRVAHCLPTEISTSAFSHSDFFILFIFCLYCVRRNAKTMENFPDNWLWVMTIDATSLSFGVSIQNTFASQFWLILCVRRAVIWTHFHQLSTFSHLFSMNRN